MRDFSGNQRGRDFRGQDLRGANFRGADIRGAKFTDADLQGADFAGTKAGLQRRWMFGQTIIAFVLSIVFSSASAVLNSAFLLYFFQSATIKQISIVPGVLIILFTLGLLLMLAKQGFTIKALSVIISLVAVAVAVAVVVVVGAAGSVAAAGSGSVAVVGSVAAAVAVAGLGSVAGAVVGAGLGAGTVAGLGAGLGTVAGLGLGSVAVAGLISGADAGAGAGAGAVTGASLLLGFYVAWRSNKGDEKFALVRSFGLALAALGGTSFSGANLTDANFAQATLKNTNFADSRKRPTNITRTNWKHTKKLDKARPGKTILANFKVLNLLITGEGINQDFSKLNLYGANLDEAKLNGANLRNADLSQARLHKTDLQNANLTEVQAIGTDFTGAYCTAACIENWNIDATTQLNDIDCQYIYLKAQLNPKGSRERRPHDPAQCLAPGDFTKLYQKILNTVEVLLQDGYRRPEAFRTAFAAIMETNPDITLDAIREIKRIGDHDALFTLAVPPDTDKAQLARQLAQAYEENR